MPKFLTFACRGFALVVPMLVLLIYYLYVSYTHKESAPAEGIRHIPQPMQPTRNAPS